MLKSIDIKEGDEIILPAFTCAAVSAPILYLKAKPVYADIDSKTYNINPTEIEKKISAKTKAVIVQNTFGLSSDLDIISEISKKHNIRLIEDCSHGIGSEYKGILNGTYADQAFFSTQWNKMYSTGIGGISVTRDPELTARIEVLQNEAVSPGFIEKLNLRAMINVKNMFGSGSNYFLLQNTYRFLSRYNLVVGSNQGKEFEETSMPEKYLKGISDYQAYLGKSEIKNIRENISHRRNTARKYYNLFRESGFEIYEPGKDYFHVFIKFSFLVKDKQKFLSLAADANLEMSDWFLSPVHPIIRNIENWGYLWGSNPIAEKVSRHVINLPTHKNISDDYMDRLQKFLNKNKSMIAE